MDFDLRLNLSLATAADLFCYSLCNDSVSHTLQRTVAGVECKTNCKAYKKKKDHGLSGGTILIFAWTDLGKIMIKFPAEIRPVHLQGTGHKRRLLLSFEQLLTQFPKETATCWN